MDKLLEKYLKRIGNYEYIHIDYWNVDGAICSVTFYTDLSTYFKTDMNINVWDMLVFLNENE